MAYDVEKVERIVERVFEFKPNALEVYLVVDLLVKALIDGVAAEDQASIVRAIATTAAIHYFDAQGKPIDYEKVQAAAADFVDTINKL